MVNAKIVSSKIPYKKQWLRVSYGSDLSMHQFTEPISFTHKEQRYLRAFLQEMDNNSGRSSKLRYMKKASQLRRVDAATRRKLVKTGRRIFNILKRVREVRVSRLKDLFGVEPELTLTLDDITRKFPWELAYDGDGFLCTLYDVGRKIENPAFVQRMSGYGPEHRNALVVGLDYKWKNREYWFQKNLCSFRWNGK